MWCFGQSGAGYFFTVLFFGVAFLAAGLATFLTGFFGIFLPPPAGLSPKIRSQFFENSGDAPERTMGPLMIAGLLNY